MQTLGIIGGIGPESTIRVLPHDYRRVSSGDTGRHLSSCQHQQHRQQEDTIVDRIREEDQIGGLILGGTELPLILRAEVHACIPLLNTARIDAEQAVKLMLQ
jgi:aspartate/glutamate racemase